MDEKVQDLQTKLSEKLEEVRNEVILLERQFMMKKEEFLKVQGALEAMQMLTQD